MGLIIALAMLIFAVFGPILCGGSVLEHRTPEVSHWDSPECDAIGCRRLATWTEMQTDNATWHTHRVGKWCDGHLPGWLARTFGIGRLD